MLKSFVRCKYCYTVPWGLISKQNSPVSSWSGLLCSRFCPWLVEDTGGEPWDSAVRLHPGSAWHADITSTQRSEAQHPWPCVAGSCWGGGDQKWFNRPPPWQSPGLEVTAFAAQLSGWPTVSPPVTVPVPIEWPQPSLLIGTCWH